MNPIYKAKLSYAAARIRVMKGKLFNSSDFEKFLKLKNLSEFYVILEKTDYGKILNNPKKDLIEIENELEKYILELSFKIARFYPREIKEVFEIYLKEWEVKNLIIALRYIFSNEEPENLIFFNGLPWDKIIKSKRIEDLTKILENTDYGKILERNIGKGLEKIEFEIQKNYVERCFKKIKKTKNSELFLEWLKYRNDEENLKNIIRGILLNQDFSEFKLEPTNIRDNLFSLKKLEEVIEKIKDIKHFEKIKNGLEKFKETNDSFWFELSLIKAREEFCSNLLKKSPFGVGLAIYFLEMKKNEVDKIKIINRILKENLEIKEIKEFV